MMSIKVSIPYESPDSRNISMSLEIPEHNFVATLLPKVPPPIDNLDTVILDALDKPVKGPKFSDLLDHGRKITIIIDNQFRPTPTHKILPPILDVIEDKKSQTSLIIASGSVPPPSLKEIENKIGSKTLERIGIENIYVNESRKREKYVFRGITSHGTPVWVHRVVALADVVIGIGMVQAEPFAGYGGGGKLILPGVSSYDTIEANHRLVISPDVYPGNPDNIVRHDIDEAADMGKLDFLIDVVMNVRGEVAAVFSGYHRAVFKQAVKYYDNIYKVKVPTREKVHVAISGTFWPTDHLYFHTGWTVNNLDLIVKDGGTIIHASPAPGYEEWHGFALMDLMKSYMPPTRENFERALRDIISGKVEMWSGCIWFKFYEVLTRKNVIIITEENNLKFINNIGLTGFSRNNAQRAVDEAVKRYGNDAKIVIIPYGKWTIPILK